MLARRFKGKHPILYKVLYEDGITVIKLFPYGLLTLQLPFRKFLCHFFALLLYS